MERLAVLLLAKRTSARAWRICLLSHQFLDLICGAGCVLAQLRTRLEVMSLQRMEMVAVELVVLELGLAVGEEMGHLDAFVHRIVLFIVGSLISQ